MDTNNPTWGEGRIADELLKIGIVWVANWKNRREFRRDALIDSPGA